MVWLSYRGKGHRIHLLELSPYEAEEIVRREPMAIVLRRPLIEHYDNISVIAMMTFYCKSDTAIKHIKIYSDKRNLEVYDTDGDLVDYPYYIHPNNMLAQSYMGTSHSGTLDSSRSNSPLSGTSTHSYSGVAGYQCARCVARCQRRCSSCIRRRLRRMSRQMGRKSRQMGRQMGRKSRRRSRSLSRYGTMRSR